MTEQSCAAPISKLERHISNRFCATLCCSEHWGIWIVPEVNRSKDWNQLSLKWKFRSEDWVLGHQTLHVQSYCFANLILLHFWVIVPVVPYLTLFTLVRTNFWTDEFFCLCNAFTRNRVNSVTVLFTRVRASFCQCQNCFFPFLFRAILDPFYTGPDKFLNGQIFYLCNAFTRNGVNSVTVLFTRVRESFCQCQNCFSLPFSCHIWPCWHWSGQIFERTNFLPLQRVYT